MCDLGKFMAICIEFSYVHVHIKFGYSFGLQTKIKKISKSLAHCSVRIVIIITTIIVCCLIIQVTLSESLYHKEELEET